MSKLLRVLIGRPVLLNLMILAMILSGIFAAVHIPKEEFPQVATDKLLVTAALPGATAEDVEVAILQPFEKVLATLPSHRRVIAEASEGRGMLTVELSPNADADTIAEEARRRLDELRNTPEDMLGLQVRVQQVKLPLLYVGLVGDPRRLDVAERLATGMRGISGVEDVIIQGAWTREIRVDVDLRLAEPLGISPSDVATALTAASRGTPLGSVESHGASILLKRGISDVEALQEVPLFVRDGSHYAVGDVATIREMFEPPPVTYRVNGQPGILLIVTRSAATDALAVVPRVRRWAEAQPLPHGLRLLPHDGSDYLLGHRLGTLGTNGLMGVVLIVGLLTWFIGFRNGVLVVIGIPVSGLGALFLLDLAGMSVNLISMFAMLLVSGIIVDDAIVIVENAQRHIELGKDRVTAAIAGTAEIAGAVSAATLTTCLAFLPLMWLEGLIGRVLSIIPIVIIVSLVVSLGEAFLMLPAHFAHHGATGEVRKEPRLVRLMHRFYDATLSRITGPFARWVVLGAVTCVVGAALVLPIFMPWSLTPAGRPVFAIFEIAMAPGASTQQSESAARVLENLTRELPAEYIRFVRTRIGQRGAPDELPIYGKRYAQVVYGFRDDPGVVESVERFLDQAEGALSSRADVESVDVRRLSGGPPVGKPLDFQVRGMDPAVVLREAERSAELLRARPGVTSVTIAGSVGAPVVVVDVNPERAAQRGLREAMVAREVRAQLAGVVALQLPVAGLMRDVRVVAPPVNSPEDLASRMISAPDGSQVRLAQVASVRSVGGVERVTRVDGQRSVRVTAELDPTVANVGEEQARLQAFFADHPEVSVVWGGEAADFLESFARLPVIALIAFLLVYVVLAVQFSSYVQPLIVLSAVPLGVAGVSLGLLSFGMDLSLIALVGAVGLIGIVVNDSLLLVEFINQTRGRGAPLQQAVREACLTRLRPIFITTATTVSGLLPLAFGLGGEEPLLAPMAVAVGVGLLFATALTLVAVPLFYLVLDDLQRLVRRNP